jgi:hypothetical protein
MKLINPTHLCVVYHRQHANGTDTALTPMHGSRGYLPLDKIPPPRAKDTMDDIGEELHDDREMWRPNPRIFQMTKTGFQQFELKLQKRIIRQQRYLEVI